MGASRFSFRIFWLILADAAMLFAGVITAMYLRLGVSGTAEYLDQRDGWLKIALAAGVCLLILYFYDLYDYVVMTKRRELLLRMVQALGIAWALLALLFYFLPPLLLGRGVSVISVPIVLGLLLGWRIFIHSLTGHPRSAKRSSSSAPARPLSTRPRPYGSVATQGTASSGSSRRTEPSRERSLAARSFSERHMSSRASFAAEKVDRVVIAVRERRGAFPTEALLKMSLAGDISIEECTSFFERITGKVHVDMLRPSWLIFAGRRRDTPIKSIIREGVHRGLALTGLVLSLPLALLTAILIKLDSRGPVFYKQERVGKNGTHL